MGTGEDRGARHALRRQPRAQGRGGVPRWRHPSSRFGNFEIFASRGEALLERLIDFTIARDFPSWSPRPTPWRRIRWFDEVCRRTAVLVAHWMRVGFVRGVMNTDNVHPRPHTIDYGPYGWVDDFDPVDAASADAGGQRCQAATSRSSRRWNLWRLASTIYPVVREGRGWNARSPPMPGRP